MGVARVLSLNRVFIFVCGSSDAGTNNGDGNTYSFFSSSCSIGFSKSSSFISI